MGQWVAVMQMMVGVGRWVGGGNVDDGGGGWVGGGDVDGGGVGVSGVVGGGVGYYNFPKSTNKIKSSDKISSS